MKKTLFVGLTLCVVASGTLFAQSGTLKVKGGEKFSFRNDFRMTLIQTMEGQEMTTDSKGEGMTDLKVKKVGKDRIDWTYAVGKLHITATSPNLPDGLDSVIKAKKPASFATDPAGRVMNAASLSDDLQLFSSGGFLQNSVEQLFSPLLTRSGSNPGDVWEVSDNDTVVNPAVPGFEMFVKRTTKYTYDGIVDTLGGKYARIRADITSMAIEGSGNMQGMTLNIDGDGASHSTSYYAADSGVLLTALTEAEISTRMSISGPMEMMIPMTYKINSSISRKK